MGLSRRTDIHTMAVRLNFMARGLAHLVQVGMLARSLRVAGREPAPVAIALTPA